MHNFIRLSLKHIIVLYLQIFNTQNYRLFKILASGLFLKYSSNFGNFSHDILIKYILIKKEWAFQDLSDNSLQNPTTYHCLQGSTN